MKLLLKLACLLLLVAGSYAGLSQTSETSPGKYYLFKNYTTQNGLLNNAIWCLEQDMNGYIWIGSDMGLTRFDGKTFYHKAIPEVYDNSAFIDNLETTSNGNLIAASFMQGVFVQQDDGRFKKYLERGFVELGQNVYNSLKYCPDGKILVGASNSLYFLTADSLKQFYHTGNNYRTFSTIDIDKENRIWFGGQFGLGILKLSGTEYEPFFLPELKDLFITKIRFDNEGTLHVATSQGYYRIKWRQPSRWESDYTVEQPFPQVKDIYINHRYLDKEQNLWIATATYGVFRTKGDSITLHLTKENGLLSSNVLCMMQDSEGNFWFGTDNGISMIENFDNYAIAQAGVRFKDAKALIQDSYNRIWIPYNNGLYVFQDDQLTPVGLSGSPIERAGIHHLDIFNSELIISNEVGLYQMPLTKEIPDLRKLRKIADYPANNITLLQSLFTDTAGIWICSQNKIYNYYNHQFLPVTFNPPNVVQRPSKIQQDKYGYYWYGSYLFGLYRGSLSRPDKNTILFDDITAFRSLKADSAFVTAWIQDMSFDKQGNLWFSTLYTGVYKLSLDSSGVVSYKLFSTDNGLLSNNVEGISCDDEGKMWFMTQQGINILQYDSTGVETIYKLDVNEGIEGAGRSSLQMGDRLYLLTDEGVFVTQTQLFKEKQKKMPGVFITNLLINGVANSKISANANNLRLAHGQNNITIEYSAITFRNADDVRYQYKLEGTDNEWSVLSDRGFVEYASLPPGRYTFKVRATMTGAETETGEETSLSFRIAPAYYQTVWFYAAIAVFVFALFYIFHKYRMRQVINMARMRTRIASDLHDDIGSTLSSISMLSEMASGQDKESELAKALSKIGMDSRDVLNSMDDIIWSVNPQNDSLSSLIVRLREYAIPVCESKDITFDMSADESIFSMKLGMEERRNIFLIVKESVNNAVKHSGCRTLSVAFSKTPELEISIQDDGRGFDAAAPTSRNGLVNMKRRATQIGGALMVNAEKGKGTRIVLGTKIV